ncbi:hypothetical protein B9Z55_009015 [Caenorhabditis nigoni]|uniref:Gamma-glutamylcyclotransferase family protein n=1 Tax=Caenorhabditis nigoni TaxID=1611254 RepID=A0A2G5UQ45_9PELO|nr:hypothetical protein B9Z55_009015 [Caenorhabditis nigoni]
MEKKFTVFVYGTLKSGEPNHKTLAETDGEYRFISSGTTMEKFPLVVGTKFNIPFLLDDAGSGNVSPFSLFGKTTVIYIYQKFYFYQLIKKKQAKRKLRAFLAGGVGVKKHEKKYRKFKNPKNLNFWNF